MNVSGPAWTRIRAGVFELDRPSGELRKRGIRIRLQEQPLRILILLLDRPGEVIAREQLLRHLWPDGTYVDFEHSLNAAVAKLRQALSDSADNPRFIETIPRRGYRFIAPVEILDIAPPEPVPAMPVAPARRDRWRRWRAALMAFAFLVSVAGVGTWIYSRYRVAPPNAEIKSLAVLPLENLSGDPAQDYFTDGVTDELITALAKINSVKVISRTSVMQYKAVHNKPLPQIARELGVDAIVEGTLARSGDRVRVTTQLIEAKTDRHIWADRYERSAQDILVLENDIARAIAERLRGKLNAQEERRFNGNPIDPAAHEAYLEGRYLWNRRTPRALQEAVRYFTLAIDKEPRYAEAYVGRASAYIVLASGAMEAVPPQEALLKAKADSDKAVQLDGTSAEAHTARAAVRSLYEWDWRGAETEHLRAIELNPSNATTRQWYGNVLCNLGRFDECLAETARAHALDPGYLTGGVEVGFKMYLARRYTEAIAPIRKVLEFNPDFVTAHKALGQVYEANRMYPEAIAELRKAVELSGGLPMNIAALGHVYAVSGHRAEARKALRTLDELATRRYVSNFPRALICAGLGENDRALEWLERAFQEHSSGMVTIKVDPRLDPLRQDARFTNLLRRVGLGPAPER